MAQRNTAFSRQQMLADILTPTGCVPRFHQSSDRAAAMEWKLCMAHKSGDATMMGFWRANWTHIVEDDTFATVTGGWIEECT